MDHVQKGIIHFIFCLLLFSYNVVIKAHDSHTFLYLISSAILI